jgi:hypothetical protein
MIAVPAGVRVMVATKPVDFRRGADGTLRALAEVDRPRSRARYMYSVQSVRTGSSWSRVRRGFYELASSRMRTQYSRSTMERANRSAE